MLRSVALGLLLLAVAACRRSDPPPPSPAEADAAIAVPTLGEVDAGAARGAVADAEPSTGGAIPSYEGLTPARAKAIGHTSVVYRLVFDDGRKAAFKPRSARGKGRYRGEIAAHRLALALGLANVPLAMPFRVRAAALRDAVRRGSADDGGEGKATAFFDAEVIAEPDGSVRGALLPWIDPLSFPPLEKDGERARWEPWIFGDAPVPEASRALAADLSTVIVFDTLTGNWDRWSGGNIGRSDPAGPLLFVDNDGAFFDPPPAAASRASAACWASHALLARLRGQAPRPRRRGVRSAVGAEAPGSRSSATRCSAASPPAARRSSPSSTRRSARAAKPPPWPSDLRRPEGPRRQGSTMPEYGLIV